MAEPYTIWAMIQREVMDVEQILEELRYTRDDRRFPRKALEHAIAAREEITPHLLSALEETRNRNREFAEESGYMAHLYAMFLLAQFREPCAYPLMVDLFSLPIDVLDRLVGDVITEDLGRLLASVCGTDTTLIAGMIENEDLDEYVRGSAMSALLSLVAVETLTREEVIGYFKELFRDKLARRASQIWNDLVSASAKLSAVELSRDIELAYRHGLVWPGYISPENVGRNFARGPEDVVARLARDPHLLPITDAIGAMEWWSCFKQPKKPPRRRGGAAAKKSPKIGRNQPCPCGSGKKYKKCCGSPANR